MQEKRNVQRFQLNFETLVTVNAATPEKRKKYLLVSQDISSSGVFLKKKTPLQVGTAVDLEVLIPQMSSKGNNGAKLSLDTQGTVVRTAKSGFAVQFNDETNLHL